MNTGDIQSQLESRCQRLLLHRDKVFFIGSLPIVEKIFKDSLDEKNAVKLRDLEGYVGS